MARRRRAANPVKLRPTCDICRGPIMASNRVGVCTQNKHCRCERTRRWCVANPEKVKAMQRRNRIVNLAKCAICGGPIRRNNLVGVCNRNRMCANEAQRRWRLTHPCTAAEKARQRAYRRAHPEMKEKNRRDMARRRAADPEGERERGRRWRRANLDRAHEHARRTHVRHREKRRTESRIRRRLAGAMPQPMCRGVLKHSYAGGKNLCCAVCGCGIYRMPYALHASKTGIYWCSAHQSEGTRLVWKKRHLEGFRLAKEKINAEKTERDKGREAG